MKTGWVIAGSLGVFIAWDLYQQAQAVKKLSYKVTGIQVNSKETDLSHTTLTLTFTLTNPTNTSILLNRIVGDVKAGTSQLAHFDATGNGFIIKPGNSTVNVPVSINNAEALATLLAVVTGNARVSDFVFTGTIYTPFLAIDYNVPGSSIAGTPKGGLYAVHGFSSY